MAENKEFKDMDLGGQIIFCILGVPVFIIVAIIMILYVTFVASSLYAWFLVPLGLPEITFWNMYGVMLFVELLTRQTFIPKKRDTALQMYGILGAPSVTLFVGWLIKTLAM